MDFKKIGEKMKADRERRAKMTPEEIRKEDEDKYNELYPYTKKAKELKEYIEHWHTIQDHMMGAIPKPSEWEASFILNVYNKHVVYCQGLSDKERSKMDELHLKYCSARASSPS